MQVILLEKINHLGDLGAIVKKLVALNSNACRLNVLLRLRKRLKSSTAR